MGGRSILTLIVLAACGVPLSVADGSLLSLSGDSPHWVSVRLTLPAWETYAVTATAESSERPWATSLTVLKAPSGQFVAKGEIVYFSETAGLQSSVNVTHDYSWGSTFDIQNDTGSGSLRFSRFNNGATQVSEYLIFTVSGNIDAWAFEVAGGAILSGPDGGNEAFIYAPEDFTGVARASTKPVTPIGVVGAAAQVRTSVSERIDNSLFGGWVFLTFRGACSAVCVGSPLFGDSLAVVGWDGPSGSTVTTGGEATFSAQFWNRAAGNYDFWIHASAEPGGRGTISCGDQCSGDWYSIDVSALYGADVRLPGHDRLTYRP